MGFIIKNMYIFIFLSNAVFPNKGQFIWTCPWGQNKALEVRQSSKFYSNPGSPIPLAVFVTYTFFFFLPDGTLHPKEPSRCSKNDKQVKT